MVSAPCRRHQKLPGRRQDSPETFSQCQQVIITLDCLTSHLPLLLILFIIIITINMTMNTNSVGQEGLTPLALACKEGNTDIVYQLVAAGAYVNLQVFFYPYPPQTEYLWFGWTLNK